VKAPSRHLAHVAVVGAGAAGLMTACELARGARRVTILEARDRCGGRIYPLPIEEFGYPAEGGPEFIHGAAPVTRALMRQAGLSLSPRGGALGRGGNWTGAIRRASSTTNVMRFPLHSPTTANHAVSDRSKKTVRRTLSLHRLDPAVSQRQQKSS